MSSHPMCYALPFQNLMKFGIHVGFGPQTANLKFFVEWRIGFRDMGG